MKGFIKRLSVLLVIVSILLSLVVIPASAATTTYSTSSNSGIRGEVCTSLSSTNASSYYAGSYTFDSLSALSSTALYSSLQMLMTSTHKETSSYDDCKNMADKTDCEQNNGKITMIYTSYQGTHNEYNSGSGWNREHVWPQSLGGYKTSGPGADLHHIRPSENKTNGDRGNLKYGEVSGGTTSKGNLSGLVGGTKLVDDTKGSYYEPRDNAKGDVARICLYMYVRYGSNGYNCGSITTVFQSVDVLLEWCELDPVDTWEMGRNEVIAAYQGNRNVFIDYPEYAWLLFGRSVPSDMVTPSGEASGGTITPGTQGGSGSGDSGNTGSGDSGSTGGTTTGLTGNELIALKNGDVVVIANPFYNKLLSMTKVSEYYNVGVDYTGSDFSGVSNDEKFTVTVNGDGSYTFTSLSGKVLALADSYTSLNDAGTHTKWTLEAVNGKSGAYFIKNVGRSNYLEWYAANNNWSTYTSTANSTDCFELAFYAAEGTQSGGNTGGSTGDSTGGTTGGGTQGGTTGGTSCKDGGTNHNWSAWKTTKEPTITEKGQAIRTCPDCQTLEIKPVDYVCTHGTTELRGAKDATCGEEGYTGNTHCADCGELLSYGTKTDKSTEHSFGDWITTKEPTSTSIGECERTCSVCGAKNYDILPTVEADSTPIIVGASVGGVSVVAVALFFILRRRFI